MNFQFHTILPANEKDFDLTKFFHATKKSFGIGIYRVGWGWSDDYYGHYDIEEEGVKALFQKLSTDFQVKLIVEVKEEDDPWNSFWYFNP